MGFDYICHKITHPMKRIIVLLVILFVSAISLAAQTDSVRLGYVVRGRVTDLSSGKPIESAHVSVPGRHHATVTNEDGDFSIKSDAPIRELIFSYVGYRTVRQRIGSEPVQVVMVPESILLEEALIVSGDPAQIVQAAVSLIQLQPEAGTAGMLLPGDSPEKTAIHLYIGSGGKDLQEPL